MPVPVKHPESTRHQYMADISWTDDKGDTHNVTWSALCSGAIDAIHQAHRFAQREQQTNADRKVVRPRLKPEQYVVGSLSLVYREEAVAGRPERREPVDIPPGPNPDLRRHKKPDDETPAHFPFVDDGLQVIDQIQMSSQAGFAEPSNLRQ